MRLVVALVVVALSMACTSANRTFTVQFAGSDGGEPLRVTVVDRTGTINLVEVAPGGFDFRDHIASVQGRPDILVVSWIGGLCDQQTELTFERKGDKLQFSEDTTRAASCRLAGVIRGLSVHFNSSVPVEAVTFVPDV
jgi:hypothetical protein